MIRRDDILVRDVCCFARISVDFATKVSEKGCLCRDGALLLFCILFSLLQPKAFSLRVLCV